MKDQLQNQHQVNQNLENHVNHSQKTLKNFYAQQAR